MAHNEEPAVLLLDLRLEAGYTFAPFGGQRQGGVSQEDSMGKRGVGRMG